ncbi:hypothetical protein BDV19DRAFT_376969 [Aspergillus venezuelensis]
MARSVNHVRTSVVKNDAISEVLRTRGPLHKQLISGLPISCRVGKSVSREKLFAYTNGRFLVNEQYQLERKPLKFDLDAFCGVVDRCGGRTSPVTSVQKFEGGFSKALLMRREDAKELLAKLPCRIAGPRYLTTAAEVGTYKHRAFPSVEKHTSIPVPFVGAEYIVMEKAPWVQSFEKWQNMPDIEKLELIRNLTQLEAQLSSILFPAYGGLYLQVDAKDFRHDNGTEDGMFSIGPSPDPSFHGTLDGGPREHSTITSDTKYSKPTLWHTDLHMGNIYVSPGKRSQITSFIDWQSIFATDYKRGLTQPELPADFETFDEDEKTAAQQELKQAKLAKAYEVSAFLENRTAHDAITIPRVVRELFIRLGETSEVGVLPLREGLIEFPKAGRALASLGIKSHVAQFAKDQEWSEVQQLAQETLDTDSEGRISPHVNFEVKRKQNKELLSMYIKRVAGEKSEEEARQIWPFPE